MKCLIILGVSGSLQLDREACETLDSIINPCCDELRQLNSGHHHKIAEITQNAGKCLLEDYKVTHIYYIFLTLEKKRYQDHW